MSEVLISSGYNSFDPLGDYFAAAALPTEQDPEVQARCEQFFNRALNLCLRFAGWSEMVGDHAVVFRTPAVMYQDDKTHATGSIWFETYVPYDQNGISLQYTDSWCAMRYRASGETEDSPTPLMLLGPASITCNTVAGSRAGRHGELNYFGIIVDKIQSAVFPRGPVA